VSRYSAGSHESIVIAEMYAEFLRQLGVYRVGLLTSESVVRRPQALPGGSHIWARRYNGQEVWDDNHYIFDLNNWSDMRFYVEGVARQADLTVLYYTNLALIFEPYLASATSSKPCGRPMGKSLLSLLESAVILENWVDPSRPHPEVSDFFDEEFLADRDARDGVKWRGWNAARAVRAGDRLPFDEADRIEEHLMASARFAVSNSGVFGS